MFSTVYRYSQVKVCFAASVIFSMFLGGILFAAPMISTQSKVTNGEQAAEVPTWLQSLQGHWELKELGGQPISTTRAPWFIINGVKIRGYDGCNTFGGSLLPTPSIRSTEMACDSSTLLLPINWADPVKQLQESHFTYDEGLYLTTPNGGAAILHRYITELDGALLQAASIGSLQELKRRLEQGANINVRNKYGNTSLYLAVGGGHFSVAEFLVKQGAEINTTNNSGYTPLHEASFGKYAMASLLLEHGAEVDAKSRHFEHTPLHLAAELSPIIAIMELLVRHGASLEACGRDFRSPLYLAAWSGNLAAVKFLVVGLGADSNWGCSRNDGVMRLPINGAKAESHTEVVEFLECAMKSSEACSCS